MKTVKLWDMDIDWADDDVEDKTGWGWGSIVERTSWEDKLVMEEEEETEEETEEEEELI